MTVLSLYRDLWIMTISHDSQIPIGIAASGSRDWSAEQKLT